MHALTALGCLPTTWHAALPTIARARSSSVREPIHNASGTTCGPQGSQTDNGGDHRSRDRAKFGHARQRTVAAKTSVKAIDQGPSRKSTCDRTTAERCFPLLSSARRDALHEPSDRCDRNEKVFVQLGAKSGAFWRISVAPSATSGLKIRCFGRSGRNHTENSASGVWVLAG